MKKFNAWFLALTIAFISFSQSSHAQFYSDDGFTCDTITLNDGSSLNIKVLTNNDAERTPDESALAVLNNTNNGVDQGTGAFVGILSHGKSPSGDFNSSSASSKISIVNVPGPVADQYQVSVQTLDAESKTWETIYSGPARCGVFQTESIGGHN